MRRIDTRHQRVADALRSIGVHIAAETVGVRVCLRVLITPAKAA